MYNVYMHLNIRDSKNYQYPLKNLLLNFLTILFLEQNFYFQKILMLDLVMTYYREMNYNLNLDQVQQAYHGELELKLKVLI